MSTLAHWRDRLFYAARASIVSLEPREAAELHALLKQLATQAAEKEYLAQLVSDAENRGAYLSRCPWCDRPATASPRHSLECEAFTPDGAVRTSAPEAKR